MLTDGSGEPIVAKQESFPAGWDAAHGAVYQLPNVLVDQLDEIAAADESGDEAGGENSSDEGGEASDGDVAS